MPLTETCTALPWSNVVAIGLVVLFFGYLASRIGHDD